MKIHKQWDGAEITCTNCRTDFSFDREDVIAGCVQTHSNSMKNILLKGDGKIGIKLFVACPQCHGFTPVEIKQIPKFFHQFVAVSKEPARVNED